MLGPVSSSYYQRVNQGDLQEDSAQLELIHRLDTLYKHLHSSILSSLLFNHQKGLYIVGDVGRGKTYLMDLFFEEAHVSKQRIHYHLFIKKLHESIHAYQDAPWQKTAKEFYLDGALLCLDEFHLRDIGDLMILQKFLRHFFKLGGILVATSNFAPNEFELYDKKQVAVFTKFLSDHVEIFRLDQGPDFRLKGKETCRRFFINKPTSPLNSFFKRSMQNELKECTYSFRALCETPVGVSYYDDLLKECDVIVVTDLNQLTDDHENSLLRFMQLVDLLYETKRSLFLYSKVSLKDIYVGIKYQRPFKRTLSRLIEITSR